MIIDHVQLSVTAYNDHAQLTVTVYNDMAVFCHILRSKLFLSTMTETDEYVELFDVEARRVLDLHVPL